MRCIDSMPALWMLEATGDAVFQRKAKCEALLRHLTDGIYDFKDAESREF